MTREEQRLQAADDYVKQRIEEGFGRTCDTFPAFMHGAKWADEHPAKSQLSARDRGFIDEIIYSLEVLEDEKKLYFGEEKEFLKKIRKL